MKPLVSIIIPTYNRAHLISDTLNSIQQQTYNNWECIVVDDGSTDSTEALIRAYITKDSRFQYYPRPDTKPKGANACRNYGFEKSKGDFINWFDSDDVMLPNKLEIQLRALNQNPKAPFCICQTKLIDKNTNTFLGLRTKQIYSDNRFEDYVLYQIFWLTTAPLWNRNFLEKNDLLFDESLYQSQEYDFHIKALAINDQYIAIKEPLVSMYMHDENLSNNIYDSDLKLTSNLIVKKKIVENHLDKFSSKGVLKLLEIQTLMFKDLLKVRKFNLAKNLISVMFKTIKHVDVSLLIKIVFCSRMVLAYTSYRVFGRGYNIVKPLT